MKIIECHVTISRDVEHEKLGEAIGLQPHELRHLDSVSGPHTWRSQEPFLLGNLGKTCASGPSADVDLVPGHLWIGLAVSRRGRQYAQPMRALDSTAFVQRPVENLGNVLVFKHSGRPCYDGFLGITCAIPRGLVFEMSSTKFLRMCQVLCLVLALLVQAATTHPTEDSLSLRGNISTPSTPSGSPRQSCPLLPANPPPPLDAAPPTDPGSIDCGGGSVFCGKVCCAPGRCASSGLCKAEPVVARQLSVSRWYAPAPPCTVDPKDGTRACPTYDPGPFLQIAGTNFAAAAWLVQVDVVLLDRYGNAYKWLYTGYARGPSFTLRTNVRDCTGSPLAQKGRVSASDGGLFSNRVDVSVGCFAL